jgi:hypothetical protein
MIDLSGYRPFRIEGLLPATSQLPRDAFGLIVAAQLKHRGTVDGAAASAGALALATWIMDHADFVAAPKRGTHPLEAGTAIERILAGDVQPHEEFAVALAQATQGAVLPEMFDQPAHGTKAAGFTPAPVAVAETPDRDHCTPPDPGPASSFADVPDEDEAPLPPLTVLGGALASGRLFLPIADSRLPSGFVLQGCGVALALDEAAARSARDAIDEGLRHIARVRGGRLAA